MKKTIKEISETSIACLNCHFFEPMDLQKRQDNILGTCKANPPIPAHGYEENKLGQWPLVLGTLWCGMFDSKTKRK